MTGTWLYRSILVGLLTGAPLAAAQDTEEAPPEEPAPEEAAPPEAEGTEDDGTTDPEPAPPAETPRSTVAVLAPLPPPDDDLPIPTLTIDRVPPRTSFEFAVHVSYGQVAYFTDAVPSWIGFGMRAGWGRNLGLHRLGATGTLTAEGDFGVHTLVAFEPTLTWDFVSPGGILLGVGAGPALMYTHTQATVQTEQAFKVAPTVAGRVGWSQMWSRVGRRLFVFVEPKVRFTPEGVTPLVALGVGSGGGR